MELVYALAQEIHVMLKQKNSKTLCIRICKNKAIVPFKPFLLTLMLPTLALELTIPTQKPILFFPILPFIIRSHITVCSN